jgi:putative colanic acid biosynthesis glycosyltransferase
MKIAHLNSSITRGGAAHMVRTLAAVQNERQNVFASIFHPGEDSGFFKKSSYRRLINAAAYRILGNARLGVYERDRVAEELMDVDVIHMHNLHGYWIDYFWLFKKIDKPVVWTWHDMWPITGRCGFSMECEGWRSGCPACPHKNYYPASYSKNTATMFKEKTRLLIELENCFFVSPSKWLAELAVERGISPQKVKVIGNPVDTATFRPVDREQARQTLGLEKGNRLLMFVANDCNNERKGYSEFSAVVESLGCTGIAIGKEPKSVHGNIQALGTLSSKEMLSVCYSAADAMLIPSIADNYPNTVLESMSCGTPVFGFDSGGIRSQMPAYWDGLVNPGNVSGLKDRVQDYFLESMESKSRISGEMRSWVIDNSSPNIVADKYFSLYRELLSSV